MDDLVMWSVGGSVLLTVALSCVGLVCTIAPFAFVGWWLWRNKMSSDQAKAAAQTWQQTTGTVLLSRVEMHGLGDNMRTEPRIEYRYEVGGQSFQSNRVFAAKRWIRSSMDASDYTLVDKYPAGAVVAVYYNPANPTESCLIR